MQKNILKILSCVLGASLVMNCMPPQTEAKSKNTSTVVKKSLIGAGIGAGALFLVGGITVLCILASNHKRSGEKTESNGLDSQKPGENGTTEHNHGNNQKVNGNEFGGTSEWIIVDKLPQYTHAQVFEANLNRWVSSPKSVNRDALFATLNMYSLRVFGKKYDSVVKEFKSKLGTNKLLFSCLWVLENRGEQYYPNEDERRCILAICSILARFEEDSVLAARGTDKKYHRIHTGEIAEKLTPFLESSKDGWTDEMKQEFEVMKKGEWFDYISGWNLCS